MNNNSSMGKDLLTIVCCIIFLVLIFKGFSLLVHGENSNSKDTQAYVCAIDVVENQLKAPSTAKFCGFDKATVTDLGNDKYKITGYVDAQNSFGAMVRERFYVTLTLTKNGYTEASCSIY